MKRILFILILIFCLASCKPTEQTIVHHEYIQHVTDSVIYHDSIVTIPHEVYTNIAWNYDTLTLETSLAKAECWVDSLWLRGSISNKQQVIYKYIEVEKVRDSIVYEKVPEPYPVVEYVKNPVNKGILWWAIGSSLAALGALCWIFRKQLMKLIALV